MMARKAEDLFDQLKKANVISYAYKKWFVYRMRLFSPRERAVLRDALAKRNLVDGKIVKSGWECVEGGAGMMDELQMVNFESNGKEKIERMI